MLEEDRVKVEIESEGELVSCPFPIPPQRNTTS